MQNDGALPMAGRRIIIVHPAWHSCGTYQVVLGQLEAWRALGADVTTVAVSDQPGFVWSRDWIWRDFVKATPELDSAPRSFAGARFSALADPSFLSGVIWPYLHGDQARMRAGFADAAPLDPALVQTKPDLVHCDHFFCMGVALRLAQGAPMMLDSHDVQARQFAGMNEGRFRLPPRTSEADMLRQELAAMRQANLLIHLNAEEDRDFRALLPEKTHALLYPAVPDVPTGPGGDAVLIVASGNRPNVESVAWFLRDVLPKADHVPVIIAGTVGEGLRAHDPELFARNHTLFAGRVDDLDGLYAKARLVLLPTIGGTGLSIKSVEAMASGLPLIATPLAFRGMNLDPASLSNVELAQTPEDFAATLKQALARAAPSPQERADSDTRAAWRQHFSPSAYRSALGRLAQSLLERSA